MINGYIPGFPQKSYEQRYGDGQIIHNDKGAYVIDGGESMLYLKLHAYCKSHGIKNVTIIITHWHLDHDTGLKAFLDVSGICVDRIYCPPPSELKGLQESGAGDDYNRACRRISQANGLKKTIIYPPAGQRTELNVGGIRCWLWRRKANKADYNNYEINNTSIQAYFPDLYYLTGGDMITKNDFLNNNNVKVVFFKGYHHGNGDGENDVKTLVSRGAKVYWYNNVEAKGTAIGGSGFSQYGAGKAKKYLTVLRTDSDIAFVAANKKLVIQKGSWSTSLDIPYDGKGGEGWYKGDKGWWYQYADGSYAIGWKELPWSGGKDWFYFNSSGLMITGWFYDTGLKAWYYLDPKTGAMVKNKAVEVDKSWYYLDEWGKMRTGWYKDTELGLRYLEPEEGKNQGHMYVNCTAKIDGKTYQFDGYGRVTELDTSTPPETKIIANTGFRGYNVSKRTAKIQYIVIHYVGAEGTAAENVKYFNGADRQASADYFVGHDGVIYQYNPDPLKNYSWHCGGGKQSSKGGTYYGKCTNGNSIGVELCTKKVNGVWMFNEATLDGAARLVKYLCLEYGVPVANVIRHFDVNGKNCPGVSGWGYTGGELEWQRWKNRLGSTAGKTLYRVRKSWKDTKSQIGAFTVLENAKQCAAKNPGFHVYDETGKEII